MTITLPWFPPAPAAGPAGILALPPDDWALEPKIDGIRVIWLDGQPFTRQGTLLTASKGSVRLRKLLADIPYPLDGEWVSDEGAFYVFDLPNSQLDYDSRRVALNLALGVSNDALGAMSVDTYFAGVRLVASFTGGQFPQVYAALRGHVEGVVLKRRRAPYAKQMCPGVECRDWLKRRFVWDKAIV